MKKRLLAWVLSFALALSLLPVGVLAAEPHPFQDVPSDHWANEAVQYAYDEGLMDGVGPTTFDPSGTLTRAMFVTILGRQDGVAEDSQGENPFTDVADGQWYTPYVTWAAQEDIVGGYGDNRFGPTDPITREQMAAILYRYAQYKGYDTSETGSLDTFPDAGEVSEYAVEPMAWTVGTGLIAGMEDNTLRPQGTATRAQAATLLMRFCETVVGEAEQSGTFTVTFESNGGSAVPAQTVEPGALANVPGVPTRQNYQFIGWYLKDDANPFEFSTPITSNIILYAQWAEKGGTGQDTLYAFDETHVAQEKGISFVDNVLLVFTAPNLTEKQKDNIASAVGGSVVGSMSQVVDLLQIRVPVSTKDELEAMAEQLTKFSYVYSVSCDLVEFGDDPSSYPYSDTDPWGKGILSSKKDWWADAIRAYDAWTNYGDQLQSIKVGIVDSGFDVSHSELNISFPNENYRLENILMDGEGKAESHGTSVAGLIAAKNNNEGLCGVAYHAEVIGVSMSGLHRNSDFLTAYTDILKSGARIINNSYGQYYISEETYNTDDAYQEARADGVTYQDFLVSQEKALQKTAKNWAMYTASAIKKGYDPLFIQAAGNGVDNSGPGVDAKFSGKWCSIQPDIAALAGEQYGLSGQDVLSHILVVGAVTEQKDKDGNYIMADFSNYGSTVNICAPGDGLYTTKIAGYTESFGGTSGAAPIVAGAAAFVWSINPSLTASEVQDILLSNHSANTIWRDDRRPEIFYRYPVVDLLAAADAAAQTLEESHGIAWGKVVESSQIPLSGVTVSAYDSETSELADQAVTDASGAYYLELSARQYHIEFEKDGYNRASGDLDLSSMASKTQWMVQIRDVVLSANTPDHQIVGVVREIDTGELIPGISVNYWSEMYPAEAETVLTDDNGQFAFMNKTIQNDWWSLSVDSTAYSFRQADNPTARGENTVDGFCGTLYVDENNCYVHGIVSSRFDYLPMADVSITLTEKVASGGVSFYTSSYEDGKFDISCPDGEYTLTVTCKGFKTYKTDIVLDNGDSKELNIQMELQSSSSSSTSTIEGTCGDNVTWKLTLDDGTLNINGTGPMEEYGHGYNESLLTTPWKDYVEQIETVNIGKGVTTIGSSAFSLCTNLKDVNIPDSVTAIGGYAFHHCYNMRSIEIPEGVTSISVYAFRNCTNLSTVTFPSTLKRIGDYVFENCFSLYMVSLPNGISTISQGLFSKCSQLTYVSIPTSVRTVEDDAFYGCSSLAEVYYGGSELDWNNIEISDHQDFTGSQSGNANLTAAVIHYNTSF